MRSFVLLVSLLVIALLHAIMLVPQSKQAEIVNTTEEIRTSHGGHHHKSMASFTDDTNDDGDDDDDDDVLASSVSVAIAPMVLKPRHDAAVFTIDATLGPSSAHARTLERPPRA